jgi:hypothetical protein
MKWGLLLAAIAALVGVPYFYQQMNETIRARVEARIAEQYPHLAVSVRSAQLVEGEGIEVRGLSVFEPGAPGPQAELLYVDELFLFCQTNLKDLVQNKIDITHFVVRRPTLRMTHRPDGSWSASKLLPLPKLGERPPVATIEGATVEIFDPLKNPSSTLRLRDANLKLAPRETSAAGKAPLRLQGQLTGDYLRQLEIDLTFDTSGKVWTLVGSVEGLEAAPELYRSIPGQRHSQLTALEALRGQARANFRLDYNAARTPTLTYEVAGNLNRGRLDDPRLPYPLTDLRAAFRCNQLGSTVDELTARCGQATLRLDMERTGHVEHSPLRLKAEVRGLALESKLVDILPDKLKSEWHKFLPNGEIDIDLKLAYDGQAWHPDVTVRCLNVSFTYHKFPYRLEHGRGQIEFRNNLLQLNVVALSDQSEVRVVGELQTSSSPPLGWVEVRGDGLRIDERLIEALPDKSSSIVRSLHPYGTFNLFFKHWRQVETHPGRAPEPLSHQYVLVTLNRCSLKYEKFPYPVDEVRGTVEMRDQVWTFRNLEGANGTGRITCTGELGPVAPGVTELSLRFNGQQILLQDELRDALPPGAKQLWNDLKPRGIVNLDTEVRYLSNERQPRIWVRAEPLEDTVSIEPGYFPYRLEKLRGQFVFSDGRAVLEQVRAEHGRTTLAARGHCDLRPEGGWSLRLEHVTIDRLRADRDFVQALPERLKKMLLDLRLTGSVNVRGAFGLASAGVPGVPFTSDWNLNVDFQQNSVSVGVPLDNVNGGAQFQGAFDGRNFRCQGDLDIHSVTYKDFQFTEVMGPLWIDDARLLVGFWADRVRQAQVERRLTYKLYGGSGVADGWVNFGPQSRYNFQSTLSQGDLARLSQETLGTRQALRGDVLANVEIYGKGSSVNDLGGRGTIQVRNADIYQLPLMVSLLKILSVRAPDSTAFTTSDMRFRIEGEHIYVDQIDFNGDAISLQGNGEVNFNKQIRLTFRSVVGRDETRMPFMRELLGGASQQIMLIHVDGTLDQPLTRREAFPVVNQALQQLQAGLQGQPTDSGMKPATPPR